MSTSDKKYINSIVKKALKEDLEPLGDITTKIVDSKNNQCTAKIIAKENGIIAGLNYCEAAFKILGRDTIF